MSTSTRTPPDDPQTTQPQPANTSGVSSLVQPSMNVSAISRPSNKSQKSRKPRRQRGTAASTKESGQNASNAPITPPRQSQPSQSSLTQTMDANPSSASRNVPVTVEDREFRNGNAMNPLPNRSKAKGTPRQNSRPHTRTPGKSAATPVQAYAGPTFHASPAPSALPIPKFFSRSVPSIDKETSLKAMMEEGKSATPSEKSDTSPSSSAAQPLSTDFAKEESPLDIFFRADREEKAKRSQNSTNDEDRAASASPLAHHTRHHARHSTDPAAGGIFTLEMDSTDAQAKPGTESNSSINDKYMRLDGTLDNSAQAGNDEEQRKAKTIALKKLLLSPPLQRSALSSPPSSRYQPSFVSCDLGSPSPFSSKEPLYQNTSKQTIYPPASKPRSSPMQNHHLNGNLPSLQQPWQAAVNGSPRPRPPTSTLRQEITPSTTPIRAELSAMPPTPTPSRPTQFRGSIESHNYHSKEQNGTLSPYVSPYTSPYPSAPTHNSSRLFASQKHADFQSMENDLRRILKLNVLRSENANEVRS